MSKDPTIFIKQPVSVVFKHVADMRTLRQRTTAFSEITKLSKGAVGQGTRFHYVRGRQQSNITLVEVIPNQKVAFRADPGVVVPQGHYEFRSVEGGTEVTEVLRPYFRGPLGILTPLIRRVVRKGAVSELASLKQNLEK